MMKTKYLALISLFLLLSACSAPKYEYLQLNIEEGFNPSEVQLAEIVFKSGERPIEVEIISFTNEYHNKKWSHEKIIDGNENTSWANGDEFDGKYPHQFVFKLKQISSLDSVEIYTGTQDGKKYRLSSFSIYGSSNQKEWTKLMSGKLDKDTPNAWKEYEI